MQEQNENFFSQEVSIATNLRRTAFLVGMTVIFIALLRFSPFLSKKMQYFAGFSFWQKLDEFFHIDTALGREQLLLVGMVLICFMMALFLQFLGIFILRYCRIFFSSNQREETQQAEPCEDKKYSSKRG